MTTALAGDVVYTSGEELGLREDVSCAEIQSIEATAKRAALTRSICKVHSINLMTSSNRSV
jgi:hypothetical protein